MPRCIECSRFTMKQSPIWARLGAGHCEGRPKHEHYGALFVRECDRFVQAEPERVAAGLAYLNKPKKGTTP